MPKKTSELTRERILKAAEQIYASHGFHGMSLREVTLKAKVNLAAVNYHFGSKDKLIFALAERWLAPINRERLERLSRLRELHRAAPVPVPALVASLLDPMFLAMRQSRKNRAIMVRLVAQMLVDDPERFTEVHRAFYQEVIDCYHAELKRSLPQLSAQQVYARFFCAFSTVLGLRLMHDSMDWFLQTRVEAKQFDLIEKEMSAFLLGGFSAR